MLLLLIAGLGLLGAIVVELLLGRLIAAGMDSTTRDQSDD